VHPHLVLQGVATGRVVLVERGQAGLGEAGAGRGDVVGRGDLDAEVVERAGGAGAPGALAGLDEHELERRLG
jgi:hypothetical protein